MCNIGKLGTQAYWFCSKMNFFCNIKLRYLYLTELIKKILVSNKNIGAFIDTRKSFITKLLHLLRCSVFIFWIKCCKFNL